MDDRNAIIISIMLASKRLKIDSGFIISIYNQLLLNNLQVISQKYGRNL